MIKEESMHDSLTTLMNRMERIESSLDRKAGDVVSYQLLQQRKEIEELTSKIEELETKIQNFKQGSKTTTTENSSMVERKPLKSKRKTLLRSFFF